MLLNSKPDNILIYHWQAWRGFLISHLVADYCQVNGAFSHDFAHLKPYLTPNIEAVLLQINLSNADGFPDHRQQIINELEARNILVLNQEVTDIRKANLHNMLTNIGLASAKASATGRDDELLFVKSNLNWGGEVETRLPDKLQTQFMGDHPKHIEKWDGYYTIKRGEISAALWQDQSVVIERYIGNKEHSFYRVYCFGDSLIVVKAHSDALIKKLGQDARDRNVKLHRTSLLKSEPIETLDSPLPRELLHTISTFLQHYPLAYFCLDILHDDQQFTIADLNLTPWAGLDPQTESAVQHLVQGGLSYLKRRRAGMPTT